MNSVSNEPSPEISFGSYLAERLIADKHFSWGVPEEAAQLAERCDLALHQGDFSLSLALIFDGESSRASRLNVQDEIVEVAKTCLQYTGRINGAKMPVVVTIYEVADGPPSEADCARLKNLQKSFVGCAKVRISCLHINTRDKTAWTPAAMGRFHLGLRWVSALLREPRKTQSPPSVPEAVLPENSGAPLATLALLTVLIGLFVIQQFAQVGESGAGILGINVGSLFALGGMNAPAVLAEGDWYRLLSAPLLHGDAVHLVFNCIALGLAAYLLETLVGKAWLILLFTLGALGGSLLGLVLNPAHVVSVGASGAVMALLTAAFTVAFRFPRGAERTQIQIQLMQFLIPSLIPLATHRTASQIDYAAHFGGALVGGLAGLALLRLWRRDEPRPRFLPVARALAYLAVIAFAGSLYAARRHYPTYAADVAFSAADLLVPDEHLPADLEAAKAEVETWGKDYPRDPRVHYYRALRFADERKLDDAESELRAALAEHEIIDRAFSNGRLETMIRSTLCALLVAQGKHTEARQEARSVCANADAPSHFRELRLCD